MAVVHPAPQKHSGPRPYHKKDLSNTAVLVEAGPVNVYSYDVYNANSAVAYIQLFNAAAAGDVTVGTTAPDAVISVKATDRAALAAAVALYGFDKGLVIAATTTPDGNTAPTTALVVSMGYQD